ncbi:MAG: hypothetical protein JWP01_2561 [Myxococcales bacterium]|nr:hypothetical protein [Myxococcales bacterium]
MGVAGLDPVGGELDEVAIARREDVDRRAFEAASLDEDGACAAIDQRAGSGARVFEGPYLASDERGGLVGVQMAVSSSPGASL